MTHLQGGGVIALFPAGVVASAKRWFGPAVEQDWSAFTAKLIQRPVVGHPVTPEQIAEWAGNSSGLMQWLRTETLALVAED